MLQMPCGGVQPMMPQHMPQMPPMPPQIPPLQQMQQIQQIQQMPQVMQVLHQWQAPHALPQQLQLGLAQPQQPQPQQVQGGCLPPCGQFRMATLPGPTQRWVVGFRFRYCLSNYTGSCKKSGYDMACGFRVQHVVVLLNVRLL
ncbi:unnamed protein product [Prorocentrum cordatum]|uniref:Uncharacterized protein n=1 Tax=Prorocentrum cordatum TaxID=2364126 RepID=A0ABN9W9C7_9DINO|nr:unnamed protein product [Polarella glacialis]